MKARIREAKAARKEQEKLTKQENGRDKFLFFSNIKH